MQQKAYSHKVLTSDGLDLSFRPKNKRLDRINITSGDLILRLVRLPKGKILEEHGHTKRMDKFLLKGHLRYDDDQEFPQGSWAKLSARGMYKVEAVEDSHLLLVERTGTKDIPSSKKDGPDYINRLLESAADLWAATRRWCSRAFLPALIVGILVIPSVLLLSFNWPSVKEESAFYRDVAISLVSALVFFGIIEWARVAYIHRSPKVYSAFDLDAFCEGIKTTKRLVRIYSTYSNLFLEEELFASFIRNATHRFKEGEAFRIEILLLDPQSNATIQRERERNADIARFIAQNILNLHRWLNEEKSLNNPLKRYVQVRIADSLPRHQHHQIDKTVNFSFYPRDIPASQSRYIKCDEDSPLGRFAVESVEEVWSDASTRSLADYVKDHHLRLEAIISRSIASSQASITNPPLSTH